MRISELDAILDTLLPGGNGFPAASQVGAGDWLSSQDRFSHAVSELVTRLPEQFVAQPPNKRTEVLAKIESQFTDVFGAFVVAAYSAYYTRSEVLSVVESQCGYKARAPQPDGYVLDPFDPDVLMVPAAREPSWRDPERETTS
jgi:hypothetical protein